MVGSVLAANGPDSLIWWDWIGDHLDDIQEALLQHIRLTVLPVGIGLLISIPLALIVRRLRLMQAPVFALLGILYTIPALAAFALVGPITGYTTEESAVLVLVTYTLLVLVRNIVIGLDGVPAEAREAARGMGYRPWQLLVRVEVPLALPSMLAGLRVATVSTVGLVTIAGVIGQGGLGSLIADGLDREFSTPLMVGAILSVALALTADLLLLFVQWLATPWTHR